MRHQGKITTWHDDRGFGFITPSSGNARVFVHIKEFKNRTRRPLLHDPVTYMLETDDQGRPRAVRAEHVGDEVKASRRSPTTLKAITPALVFLTLVTLSTSLERTPPIALIFYLTISTLTFLAYAKDKSAAANNRWRTPEATLHLLALAGGWPGACVAQQLLRHKTKKSSFRTVYWLTVITNCSAWIWLHTGEGQTFINNLLSN